MPVNEYGAELHSALLIADRGPTSNSGRPAGAIRHLRRHTTGPPSEPAPEISMRGPADEGG
jgi:hypothetical protein